MIRILKSTKLAVVLCLVLSAGGIAGSLLYQGNTAFGKQGPYNVFRSPLFLVPACLLILNIFFCAWSRLASMPLSGPRTWSFAGIHLGLLLMASALILDGLFGFLGTRYYYLGVPDSSYFDWRKNREEPFPFTVEVAAVETRHHPLNLQVGVRDPAGKDAGTYNIREGGSFEAGKTGLVVTPRRFDNESKYLFLDAAVGGTSVSGIRAAAGSPAVVGGYSIFPVAFADPEPSGHAARVRFTLPGRGPEEKEIRINHPARYAGLSFCLVDVGADRFGNPYAGLQMTREPGETGFWIGALMFSLSLLVHFRLGAGMLALFLLGLAPCVTHAFGTVIDGKTEWAGEVRIAEPVTVEKGGVLRIRPGTTVFLSGEDRDGDGCRDGYIQVFGKILVEGEQDRPVRFI
ncbi:MAG: hypothetical protein HW408_601, partial [Actinobacteria bacterium]|nr:hypothetical protein [Actinomycetota bacterium]